MWHGGEAPNIDVVSIKAFSLTTAEGKRALCRLLAGYVLWRIDHESESYAPDDLLADARHFLSLPDPLAYLEDQEPCVDACFLCGIARPYGDPGAIWMFASEEHFVCSGCALALDCSGVGNYAFTPPRTPTGGAFDQARQVAAQRSDA